MIKDANLVQRPSMRGTQVAKGLTHVGLSGGQNWLSRSCGGSDWFSEDRVRTYGDHGSCPGGFRS